MGARRPSKRRRRRRTVDPPETAGVAPRTEEAREEADPEARAGYGKASLLLALLLGTLIERMAAGVLPTEALDVVHLAIGVAIAFLVARWYRGFMRRTLGRTRAGRQRSRTSGR